MTETSTLTHRATRPDCEDCDVPLERVGRGEHPYWSCGYCGNTVPAQ